MLKLEKLKPPPTLLATMTRAFTAGNVGGVGVKLWIGVKVLVPFRIEGEAQGDWGAVLAGIGLFSPGGTKNAV